jgi:hypothetical protein
MRWTWAGAIVSGSGRTRPGQPMNLDLTDAQQCARSRRISVLTKVFPIVEFVEIDHELLVSI